MNVIEMRRLRKGEVDHELLWLLVGAGTLVCAWVWRRLALPWPHCIFLDLTGIPCPTCGATRCLLFLARGQFFEAIRMNPLAFCALGVTGAAAVYAITVLLFRLPRVRIRADRKAARFVRITVAALLAANWSYLIFAGRV
jgi:hypothetical protein